MADGDQTLTPPPDPVTGGEFLLQLLRQPPRSHQPTPPIPIAHDPAVAAVGRGFHLSPPPGFSDLGGPQFAPWMFPPGVRPSPPGFSPPPGFGGGFVENPGLNRDVQLVFSEDGRLVAKGEVPVFANQGRVEIRNDQGRCLGGRESRVGRGPVREVDSYAEIGWVRSDGLNRGERGKGVVASVSLGNQWRHEGPLGRGGGRVVGSGSRDKGSGQHGCANERVGRQYAAENGVDLAKRDGHSAVVRNSKRETLQRQVVGGVRPEGFDMVMESDIDRVRMLQHQGRVREERQHEGNRVVGSAPSKATPEEENLLVKQFEDSLMVNEESVEKNESKVNGSRSKDFRSDFSRGHHVSSQRTRIRRGAVACRHNISRLTQSFLSIFESLVPAEEEITKQRQLLSSLKVLVKREWPDAELHLYGSCANSFGVSNSDIDVCLAIDDTKMSKSEIILRLADVLQEDNLQDVQALTRARVPIVKLKDPKTRMSCDICINNLLAVVNTKLLRDYAQIDERLRQLAFLVKYWAKSRDVNETYQGTLSSYAYVLMCIHFLQQRTPPVLPCLQEMQSTYAVTVDDVQCSYFDKIEELHNFGASNRETVAELLWSFFNYWAFQHDYANDVISVRTGGFISKQAKDWTRRVGNDRHLICIEDPFETSHDLGRVVDKRSIRILREEFERAADVLQYDQNPCVTLFERYVRQPTEENSL